MLRDWRRHALFAVVQGISTLGRRCTSRPLRRRSGSPDDRPTRVQATRRRFRLYREKKEACVTGVIVRTVRSFAAAFFGARCRSGLAVTSASTSHTADGFAAYISKKIEEIRSATADLSAPEVVSRTPSTLSSFRPCTSAEVRRIVMTSPWLVRQSLSDLLGR